MDTNLKIGDVKYLWDFYKERDTYKIESIYMDYDYLYTPPAAEYGGAWVLAPIGNNFSAFRSALDDLIYAVDGSDNSAPEGSEIP